ncbi:Glycerate dehydrogenase [Planctomycetes bacterium Poly30]|uniref:Glycerate dehydrogenase n=1 Tax=Saltatorellus ferox TaxID=2528018 RepID=A0A518ET05_9BACT|nr:Glycerate dehydrogenase [Planctomycetes bacterium Poly30]
MSQPLPVPKPDPLRALALLGALILGGCAATSGSLPAPAVGSLEGARVATPTDDGTRQLLFLAGPMEPGELAALEAAAPNVRCVVPESEEEALRLAPEAHGADGRICSPEFLTAAEQLVWVQSPSAGVAWLLERHGIRERGEIVLTNMQGIHGPAIAEHVFGMLLTLTRDIGYHQHPDRRGAWEREGSGREVVALSGRTMLVVGLGGIGSEVARRAHGFDMTVLATRRSRKERPAFVDRVGTAEDLEVMLPLADVVVLCVPLTEETEGMIDARTLGLMKPGAYLVNIARGAVVDTDALVGALESGRLAGACLDVTDPEPLPPGHVLWSLDNVVITPHVASRATLTNERRATLLEENLRRFGAGEPLLNVVDKAAGY